jgi:eukaryotic-like serine/threonine-protein kinase
MHELSAGDDLDQFHLDEVLAHSGFATIFKGVDTLTGAPVAIKVPYQQFESDVIFHQRFQREEEVLRRLHHPNIVRAVTPRHKSQTYIAMEFVEGPTLRSIMRERAPMPTDQALSCTRQVCDALAYMHRNGVVHRDLKPENILISPGGAPKLIDFGITLDLHSRRLTWSGLSSGLGTPDYMAPEQVAGGRGDARSDVYALGVILFEMFTGSMPFAGENPYEVIRAKTSEDPITPRKLAPGLDPAIEEIILHAIERLPRLRYANGDAMLQDLRNPRGIGSRNRARRLGDHGRRMRRMHRAGGVAAFFLVVGALLVLITWAANPYPAPGSRISQPRVSEK